MKILWKFVFLALLGISAVRARAEDEFLYFPITGNEEVTCGFCGYYYRSGACHGATDIDTTNGATEIYAAAAGEVVRVVKSAVYCRDDPFGTHVVLEHSNDYRTIYAHLLPGSTAVEVGDNVEAGQFLGIGDTTGCAWGSHLHFEVRDSDGNRVDPYDGSAEQQAMCLPTLSTEECGENSLWVSCPPEPYDAALAADADRDGFTVAQGDCDDSNRDVYPDAPERCDGIDNNCSGRADENFIILGTPCSAGIGECQAGGVWQCNSTRDDVSCSAVPLDPPEAIDIFGDGLDNNCNGETDEFEGDCPPGMALIPSIEVCIDRYEASRPPGMRWPGYGVAETAVPQSVAGAMPWNLTTWAGHVAACVRAGKHLCRASEWLLACRGVEGRTYPYGDEFDFNACREFSPIETGSYPRCVTPEGVFDLSGNMFETMLNDLSGAESNMAWGSGGGGTYSGGGDPYYSSCMDPFVLDPEEEPGCLNEIPETYPDTDVPTCRTVATNDGFRCCWSP